MHKIKILKIQDWTRKITHTKKRLEGYRSQKYYKTKFARQVCETKQICCYICEKSLQDHIGKEIVKSVRTSNSKYYHKECALSKGIVA